jgi:hypothetical protein
MIATRFTGQNCTLQHQSALMQLTIYAPAQYPDARLAVNTLNASFEYILIFPILLVTNGDITVLLVVCLASLIRTEAIGIVG